ncbi:MAG TPA: ribose 5-phosphate isomerase B [Candidatus Egerieicola pullicola]|uniref:Ribose 5-phosphate isomerase B n=2 Tax=Candidatus Egerieicola TaxID=2840629 RepID=A0A9D1DE88_9FIRM|nr:ribose 5-phosphate isomerase B [Candidatus Egerieicola pullicola]HIU42151.1 ribose 5-phosphate isomerase B [Candidatus Egerieicola faecale]
MIAVCCDHGGLSLKQEVLRHLEEKGLEYKDFGTNSPESCDYPDIVKPLCQAIQRGECDKGVIICGTGIGISMAANKMKGIRAALCHDSFSAEFTRRHNDSNIIAFGARVIGPGLALQLLDIFLNTPFEGGRHAVRVEKMMALEQLD